MRSPFDTLFDDAVFRPTTVAMTDRVGDLGATRAAHAEETAGAYELLAHEVRQARYALDEDNLTKMLDALARMSYWLGRAYQSQTSGGIATEAQSRAISMETRLKAAIRSHGRGR